MSKISRKKQLKFKCLASHIQDVMKLNFAISDKNRIFAHVNQQYRFIERKRISLFRERELGHFTKVLRRNEAMISRLLCIRF